MGFPDGTFRPDDPVNRAQMALFLTRAFDGLEPVDSPVGVFADVSADASHAAAVEGIYEAGVTQGCQATPDLRFCPKALIRHDEIASFLIRALNRDPNQP